MWEGLLTAWSSTCHIYDDMSQDSLFMGGLLVFTMPLMTHHDITDMDQCQ